VPFIFLASFCQITQLLVAARATAIVRERLETGEAFAKPSKNRRELGGVAPLRFEITNFAMSVVYSGRSHVALYTCG
jgi:hypothetical protein